MSFIYLYNKHNALLRKTIIVRKWQQANISWEYLCLCSPNPKQWTKACFTVTRDFYQLAGIFPGVNQRPYTATMPISVGCWILPFHERRMGRDRKRGGGKRKRKMNLGSMCVCAFKSPQAMAECWESHPVPFSWPLRGGLLPSASMDGDGTSERQPAQLSLGHCFSPPTSVCTHSSNCCSHFDC